MAYKQSEKHPHLMALEEKAARFLKAELKRADVTYEQLAEKLKAHGFEETKASIANKLVRGTFPASFMLAAMRVIGKEDVSLSEIYD